MGLCQRHRDHYAFSCRQAISLDDDGRAFLVHVTMGFVSGIESSIGGGGNAVALHESLGKILGGFQLRSLPGRDRKFSARRRGKHPRCPPPGVLPVRRSVNAMDSFLANSTNSGIAVMGTILQAVFHARAGVSGRDKDLDGASDAR